jgi:isopentenyl diphosphate isomerase/L-lactate dehydrogenase-like FMN-dependent dehydrogenase
MILNIDDLRSRAKRRLPRVVFDYVEGGAGDEVTVRRNLTGFERYAFRPRVFTDVAVRDQSTTLLGERIASPLMLAPTGLIGTIVPRAEIMAARAAEKMGIPFALSSMATCSLEDVARAAHPSLWFQMYIWRDRGLTRHFVERARAAGCRALCLTLDVQVLATRDRDARNGFFTVPSRVTAGSVLGALAKPGWLWRQARGPFPTFANFAGVAGAGRTPQDLGHFATQQLDPSVTWRDLDWFRSIWSGPLALKGILSAGDAALAVDHGADAVVVSNHGGRQLDGAAGAIEALPEVVDAVAGRADVILDGGVRRGRDVVKAIALGARACMIGRPFVYGLAAMGERGAERAIEILRDEVDRTMALLGVSNLASLDRAALYDSGTGTCL